MDKYYREQLRLLREGASAFGRQYPAIAPMLEPGDDPDVERILEGTAYLCGKIHERLDQTAPDLVQSLLRLVFPQALLPVPSCTLIRFTPQPGVAEALSVRRGTQLASNPVDGVPCIYSVSQNMRILPLEISTVRRDVQNARSAKVSLTLRSAVPLSGLLREPLVLHLAGGYALASQRLLMLLTQLDHVEVSIGSGTYHLPASVVSHHLAPLEDQRLLAGKRRNRSYMDLMRYFNLPEQLLFVQIADLGKLPFPESGTECTLTFCFGDSSAEFPDFPQGSFALNVVPAANVFQVSSDPFAIDHTQEEYLIHPQDSERRFLEIISVDSVTALMPGGRIVPCRPYETYDAETDDLLYNVRFRPSMRPGVTEHLLIPLYRPGDVQRSMHKYTLSLNLYCCNHTLPGSLRVGDICRPTDSSPAQATFTNIVAPTPFFPRSCDESLHWRFLSHLNTNLLSLASPQALRSLLELYLPDVSNAPELTAANLRRCVSIRAFTAQNEEMLFRGRLLRGRGLHLTLDPSGFVSEGDLYLFANTLDRFFIDFTIINNYSRLYLKVSGKGTNRQWPPRLGEKRLI